MQIVLSMPPTKRFRRLGDCEMVKDKFSRKASLWVILAAFLLFIPAQALLPFNILIEMLNAVAVSIGIGVLFAYGRGILQGYRRDGLTPGHLLAIGIFFSWLAVVIRLLMVWTWRITGWEEAVTHWSLAFAVWMFILGGALHLTAREAIEYHIPRSHWLWLSLLISVGVFIGLVVLRLAVR